MKIERSNDIITLTLFDRLNAYNAPRLKEQYLRVVQLYPVKHIIIDLSEIKFMDSAGLAALVSILKRSSESEVSLSLAGLTAPVQIMFDLMRLDKVFTICKTVEEAKSRL